MTNPLIEKLRDYDNCHDGDVDEAADMLEFFFGRLQSHNLTMGGNCNYRFRSGWPMQYCVGQDPLEAVRNAVAEIKRERSAAKNAIDDPKN